MQVLLLSLLALSIVEVGMWWLWRWRLVLCAILVFGLSICSSALIVEQPRLWTITLGVFSAYRIFNLLRIVRRRMQPDYLRQVSRRTSWWLQGLQILVLVVVASDYRHHLAGRSLWAILTVVQLVIWVILYASTQRQLNATRGLSPENGLSNSELPSLTVAIPARNETQSLEACLSALIASDYPKLEIIVLDDRSQNQRTPEIIKQFAHDGVRFIAGQTTPSSWLAKNFAYQQLADAANGEMVLFCGVDARFEPIALRALVSTMLNKQKSMISVLPYNTAPVEPLVYLVQPVRYAWELCPPRRLFNRPPVLSTCWIIKRSFLHDMGGFKAASRTISPESYFARAARLHDGYRFGRSNLITSDKSLAEQLATATRTRYPQLHRRPELIALLSVIELCFVVGPLPLAIVMAIKHQWLYVVCSGLAYAMSALVLGMVIAVMYKRRLRVSYGLAVPLMGLYDVGLGNYSMWKYEFDQVIWKGRDASVAVMRAEGA